MHGRGVWELSGSGEGKIYVPRFGKVRWGRRIVESERGSQESGSSATGYRIQLGRRGSKNNVDTGRSIFERYTYLLKIILGVVHSSI